ncbi:MAG: hypothetical protein RL033_6799 [Pseudomonadota bacterium]|jgi:hypothetical protein
MKFRLALQHTSPDSSSAPRALGVRTLHRIVPALALLLPLLPACADGAAVSEGELVLNDSDVATDSATATRSAPVTAALTTMAVKTAGGAEPCAPGEETSEVSASPASTAEVGSASLPVVSPPVLEAANTVQGTVEFTEPETSVSSAPVPGPTMRTEGNKLLDSCGKVFVTRGVEQIFGNQLPEGNDWGGLLEEIAASGVNAVRILAGTNTLTVSDVDHLLDAVADHGLVAYVTPYGNEAGAWLGRPEVRTMLAKHESYILIDTFGEPTFDDRERFVAEATESLRRVRGWGYRVPLTVTANQFGRDLPSILELGQQIAAADPLGNTVFGWQAYWSSSGYYQGHYGMSLEEGVRAAANAPFPVQLGLDRITDFPSDVTADFQTLMTATQANGIGWLWWDWYNPYGNENNLSQDGSLDNLTATGRTVVQSHAASVRNTSRLACSSN